MDWEPRVGMKVFHTPWRRSRFSKHFANANMPVLGKEYTIRKVFDYGDVVLVLLAELDNSHLVPGGIEPGFNTSGFRPANERKSDISIFTAMLVNPPKELAYTVPNRPFE